MTLNSDDGHAELSASLLDEAVRTAPRRGRRLSAALVCPALLLWCGAWLVCGLWFGWRAWAAELFPPAESLTGRAGARAALSASMLLFAAARAPSRASGGSGAWLLSVPLGQAEY